MVEPGERRFNRPAAARGCRSEELYRVLRALSNIGIVRELPDRKFQLTSLGEHLRTRSECSLRGIAALYGERWIWNAYGNLMHSVRTAEPALDAVHGQPFFDYLQEDAAAARTAGEYCALLKSAGLRRRRTLATASAHSLIEATTSETPA